jgi:hypothetical protein
MPRGEFWLKFTSLFVIFSGLLALVCAFLDFSIKIDSTWFNAFFYRGDDVYNSNYFSFGKFLYFCIMNVIGIAYTNVVTLQRPEVDKWSDGHNTGTLKITACITAPILFFLSGNLVLRGSNDLVSTDPKTAS